MTAGGMEALYPFLHPASDGLGTILADAEESTAEKLAEVAGLRESLAPRFAGALTRCAFALAESFSAGGRLLAFGNGGSATDAHAFTTLFAVPPPPAVPLSAFCLPQDTASLTALANDVGFESVFSRRIASLGRRGDVAVGLSTSGGSVNLLRGLEEATRLGMVTVGFAGYDGGPMAEAGAVDHLFVVPSTSVHRIQEVQATLYHVLWELVLDALRDAP